MKTSPRNAAVPHYSPAQVHAAATFLTWLGHSTRRNRKAVRAFLSGSRRNMTQRQLALATTTIPAINPISEEIAAFYDSRRLTEEDVDHMAELHSEGRVYNRNASLRSSHE
jgi:hypothetical protein